MTPQERLQQRRLVGWWLDVPTSNLVGENSFARHLGTLRRAVEDEHLNEIAQKANKAMDWSRRRRLVEEALKGVAFSVLAEEEGVKTGAVSALVRDTLARLAVHHLEL